MAKPQVKQTQVIEVLPPVPMIGTDLNAPHARAIAAGESIRNFRRSSKARIVNSGEVDFAKLGAETADLVLDVQAEAKAEMDTIRKYQRVTTGMIWLGAAMEIANASDPTKAVGVVHESFKAQLTAKGHKRASVDASEFKVFIMAYLVSPDEVMGVLAESGTQSDAMKVLREIRDTGKPARKHNTPKARKPSDKTMAKIMEAFGRMDAAQLTKVYAAGLSRAKVLRKQGEVFEAFAKK